MALNKSMSQNEVIAWIESLTTDASFTSIVKQQLIDGIKKYAKEEGSEVTGEDLMDAEDWEDIKEMCKVDGKKAKAFFKKINGQRQNNFNNTFNSNNNDGGVEPGSSLENDTFQVNILAQQGQIIPLENVTKSWKVSQLKAKYLQEQGNLAAADSYRNNHKWDSNEGKIEFLKSGKPMKDDKTLEYYDIVNGLSTMMPIVVGFKVIGGAYNGAAEAKYNDDEDDEDQYRKRKLRRKKHKGIIKFTSLPDCIMGYTDDDGIKRAEMPCGCGIASDTMWRYMKALFEKDYKSTKLFCPTPKKQCKGNDEQRHWPWSLVFVIADLSDKEIARYSKIISNRVSGSKPCPHCKANTERPNDLRICRVRCTQCPKFISDWCWNCGNVWKSGGLGPICGNKNCMGQQINNILAQCEWLVPEWSDRADKNGKVPRMRACPNCTTTLEYTSACKHMWCICCPHEFCFNCLQDWKSGKCSHSISCNLHPVQKFT